MRSRQTDDDRQKINREWDIIERHKQMIDRQTDVDQHRWKTHRNTDLIRYTQTHGHRKTDTWKIDIEIQTDKWKIDKHRKTDRQMKETHRKTDKWKIDTLKDRQTDKYWQNRSGDCEDEHFGVMVWSYSVNSRCLITVCRWSCDPASAIISLHCASALTHSPIKPERTRPLWGFYLFIYFPGTWYRVTCHSSRWGGTCFGV